MNRIRLATATAVIGAIALSAGPALGSAPTKTKIAGTVSNTSLVINSVVVNGNTEEVDATGAASIAGDAVGTVAYTVHVKINTVSHLGLGRIDETFTGSVGTRVGTIDSHGIIGVKDKNGLHFRSLSLITGGTGDFASILKGVQHVSGTIDLTTGTGTGSYGAHVRG
jgi:hypothetical protein